MYHRVTSDRERQEVGPFGRAIEVEEPSTHTRCHAEERRIQPIVEAAAAMLVPVSPRFLAFPDAHIRLHHAAHDAYLRLKRAAEADGIPPHLLTIVSGYRSVARQVKLWKTALQRYGTPEAARVYVAPPGSSAHHTGRAIDFHLGIANDSRNIPAQRTTAVYRWLVCHAARFGFTPYAAEPWHWEYNPPLPNPVLLASGAVSPRVRRGPVG